MKKLISVLITLTTLAAVMMPANPAFASIVSPREQEEPAAAASEEAVETTVKPSIVTSRSDKEEEQTIEPVAPVVEEVYEGQEQPEPEYVNPLTGEGGFNPDAVGKRPVAVMINNHPDNYPQYNVSKADVLFEVVVEHEYSRFMGLFADYTNVPYIVSVRSYRYYFPMISSGFDAFYVHWGEDQTMMWYYDELELDSYDGLSNEFLFGRDQDRVDADYALEHTSCFYGDRFPEQIEEDGKRTDLKEAYIGPAFHFVPYGTVRIPQGDDCNFADIFFGDEMSSQFTYDPLTRKYQKFANEEPQMDGISQEQFAFDNVIVLYTKIITRDDEPEADRKFLEVFGSRNDNYTDGFYLTQGKIQPIKWEKADEWDRLRFYGLNGKEIELNRGKTYIAYSYDDSAKFSASIPSNFVEN